jgi:hypothetical protein
MIFIFLKERNYKVWMNSEHMFDDLLLVRMVQAVENSYIILLCINQDYYESDYCRLGKGNILRVIKTDF